MTAFLMGFDRGAGERVSQPIWICHAVGKRPPALPKNVPAARRDIGRTPA